MLLQTLGEKIGDIVSETGKILGKHRGAYLYTIGQRQGLGLSGGPWYVVNIHIETNIVAVSTNLSNLQGLGLIAKNPNWHQDLPDVFECSCQIRYQQTPVFCTVKQLKNNTLEVKFAEPTNAIAKGQSIVFYLENQLLGGAIIDCLI
jgi:tRNA-specific 2-thiouridylase